MKKLLLLAAVALTGWGTTTSQAQEYLDMIEAGTFTIDEIRTSAEAYFEVVGTGRGTGFKQFKRWEYMAERQQDDDGRLKPETYYINELRQFEAYLNENPSARSAAG